MKIAEAAARRRDLHTTRGLLLVDGQRCMVQHHRFIVQTHHLLQVADLLQHSGGARACRERGFNKLARRAEVLQGPGEVALRLAHLGDAKRDPQPTVERRLQLLAPQIHGPVDLLQAGGADAHDCVGILQGRHRHAALKRRCGGATRRSNPMHKCTVYGGMCGEAVHAEPVAFHPLRLLAKIILQVQ